MQENTPNQESGPENGDKKGNLSLPPRQISSPRVPGPGTRIGDYILGERIARGGMGTVFQAQQISMQRIVALKVLHRHLSENEIYMRRFIREVRTLASLEHPNLVHAIEVGMLEGTAYFSMEFVKGPDLKRKIDLEHFFSETEAFRIARDVAKAMAYAWNKARLVHRDLKPANIILSEEGVVKLLDLGISKQAHETSNDTTFSGMMVGSPTYISPEQAVGEANLDCRADIYSLGVTLFHLLAGAPPYDSHNAMAVVSMHLAAEVPDVREARPDVSERGAALIYRMMAKKREDRPASWEELIEEFENIIREVENPAPPPKSQGPQQQRPAEKGKQEKRGGKARIFFHAEMQTHRLIALGILLLLFILALLSTIQKGLRENRERTVERNLYNLIALKDLVPPEKRNSLIRKIEKTVLEAENTPLENKAQEVIAYLNEKTLSEKRQAYENNVLDALNTLNRRSREMEAENRMEKALSMWRDYEERGEFRNDPRIQNEIRNSIEYLNRRLRETEGFSP